MVDNIEISSPTLKDIPEIQELLKFEIEAGNILLRTNDEIATNIRSYLVAKDSGKIVGCVALHIYSTELAEFRSMLVHENYRENGIGKMLIQKGFKEAERLGLKTLLVLTYKSIFFNKLGFREISKMDIPNSKIWADCIKCTHFPVCEEVALVKNL
jgi:amino-acid N-acetyltransferase